MYLNVHFNRIKYQAIDRYGDLSLSPFLFPFRAQQNNTESMQRKKKKEREKERMEEKRLTKIQRQCHVLAVMCDWSNKSIQNYVVRVCVLFHYLHNVIN